MMNQQPPFPMQPMAEQMAQQGRYGDSMMVHMNPIEVAGIASLSPTGQLTTNPMTGQPEAFLPFLAPLLGSMFGSSVLGAAGSALGTGAIGSALTAAAGNTALASAIGSGLATTAVTGDLKEGLMSGLTGFGIGKALGAAKDLANPAIGETAAALGEAQKAATTAGVDVAKANAGLADVVRAGEAFSPVAPPGILGDTAPMMSPTLTASQQAAVDPLSNLNEAFARKTVAGQRVADLSETLGDLRGEVGLGDIANLEGAGNVGKALLTPGAAVPIAIGEGERAAMKAQEDRDRMFGIDSAEKEEERRAAEEALRSGRFLNVTGEGYDKYSYLDDSPYYSTMSGGGITSINPSDFARRQSELYALAGEMPPVKRMQQGGRSEYERSMLQRSYGLGDSAAAQAALRGAEVITPEELVGYRPGFDAEISYFRDPLPVDPVESSGSGGGFFQQKGEAGAGAGAGTVVDPDPFGGGTGATYRDYDPSGGRGSAPTAEETSIYETAKELAGRSNYGGPGAFRSDPGLRDRIQDARSTVEEYEKAYGLPGKERESRFVQDSYYRPTDTGAGETSVPPPTIVPPAVAEDPMVMTPEASVLESTMRESLEGSDVPEGIAELIMAETLKGAGPGIDSGMGGYGYGMQEGRSVPNQLGETGAEMGLEQAQMLLDQARMAILGELPEDESEAIINRFIDEFGIEIYQQLRTAVLEQVVPNSQKEGLIEGEGGGMDDMVPGMIGGQQPVAVSPGEFIVPADVVSGLGDGDTNAGAEDLEGMMDRVRMERTGTTQQPPPIMAKGGQVLPA